MKWYTYLICFILIIVGFVCGKTGVITGEGKKMIKLFKSTDDLLVADIRRVVNGEIEC